MRVTRPLHGFWYFPLKSPVPDAGSQC